MTVPVAVGEVITDIHPDDIIWPPSRKPEANAEDFGETGHLGEPGSVDTEVVDA